MVRLATVEQMTGQERTTAVGGFPDRENAWLVVASLGGSAHRPAWFLKMAKHPGDTWLEVGKERIKVRGETLARQERTKALARVAAIAPPYGTYRQQADREIPIVRLTPES